MSDDLIAEWIADAESGADSGAPWDTVNQIIASDPEAGWALVLALIEAAPDDAKVLGLLAAGPLEDLIIQSAPTVIDRVEVQARRDPKFRRCLTGVWFESELPAEIAARIKKYTSTVVHPLSR